MANQPRRDLEMITEPERRGLVDASGRQIETKKDDIRSIECRYFAPDPSLVAALNTIYDTVKMVAELYEAEKSDTTQAANIAINLKKTLPQVRSLFNTQLRLYDRRSILGKHSASGQDAVNALALYTIMNVLAEGAYAGDMKKLYPIAAQELENQGTRDSLRLAAYFAYQSIRPDDVKKFTEMAGSR